MAHFLITFALMIQSLVLITQVVCFNSQDCGIIGSRVW